MTRSPGSPEAASDGRRDDIPTVLFVATPAMLGGSNRSLVTLLGRLEGRVNRVLAAPPFGSFIEMVRDEGLADEYIDLPRRPQHPLDRVLRLAAGFRIAWWAVRNRKRLAAVHANALTGLNLSTPAALAVRRPLVVWIHDPVGSRWGRRLGPLLRRTLPRLRIAAVSPTAEAVAVDNGLCDTGDASIIPNPIDPAEVLAPAATDPARAESGEPLRIGILGGATERKGFDLMPAVIGGLLDLGPRWRLYVYLEPDAENAATWDELAGFPDGVVDAVGKTPDVRNAYADLDIVFCPSRAESFCRVAAEAMMNGLPVVGSDIDPLVSLLAPRDGEDSGAGLLFASGDPAAAVTALRTLATDPELRATLGAEGRRRAAAFAPEHIADELIGLYEL